MAKTLSETAATIITTAAARDDRRVLPIAKTVKAPAVAVTKVLKSLLADGLIEEVPATRDDESWAQSGQHGRTTLTVTDAGLAAVGIEEEARPTKAHKGRTRGKKASRGAKAAKAAPRAPTAAGGGKTSKQDVVIALLRRGQGASVEEMMEATGWLPHSVRGFMSGALKKQLGLPVVSVKHEKTGERRYQIAALRT